ncbi:MAG: calcium-binding protein [Richelia sp. SM1_7_0]|nr:calcium-binding protein [Richelia sp. SM1_7_0]
MIITGGTAANSLTFNTNQNNQIVSGIAGLTIKNFEKFDFSGFAGTINFTGNANPEEVIGTANNDTINSGAGNDILAGGSGDDSITGGAGNDTYFVDSLGDTISELNNEGIDTVESSVTWTLANHLENLRLSGIANINATGNDLSNFLRGNNRNNILDGGAGDDN